MSRCRKGENVIIVVAFAIVVYSTSLIQRAAGEIIAPMRVEVLLAERTHCVGVNFPIVVRILNPNDFDVRLRGFEFGALEPRLAVQFPGSSEFTDLSNAGTVSPYGGPPITIPRGGFIESRRLIFTGTRAATGHWISWEPGIYRLRFEPHVCADQSNGGAEYIVAWSSQEVELQLVLPIGRDREALFYLRSQAMELMEQLRSPGSNKTSFDFQVGFRASFLEKFSETVYEPEIRFELARLLGRKLGDGIESKVGNVKVVDLWDDCVNKCLSWGGAYADEFTQVSSSDGTNGTLALAEKLGRVRLAGVLNQAIDERYPADRAGILLRQARYIGAAGDANRAGELLRDLLTEYPSSVHFSKAKELLDAIDRGWWPKSSPSVEKRQTP